MAWIKPKFNQKKFFQSVLKQLEVIETDADGWFEWEGIFGPVGETVDGVVIGEAVGEAKAKIQEIIDGLPT